MKKLIFSTLLFISTAAFAEENFRLCDQNVEGTYSGTMGALRVKLNLFCIDSQRMSGVFCHVTEPGDAGAINSCTNMTNTAIEGDKVILSNFLLGSADRKTGSSKSTIGYGLFDLDRLLKFELNGIYLNGSMVHFDRVRATRTQIYPIVNAVKNLSISPNEAFGEYEISNGGRWAGSRLLFAVFGGVPVVSLARANSSYVVHFTDGIFWDNSGLISIATSEGNGGEPDDLRMFYLRGHFTRIGQIEFYLMTPGNGLEGPLLATRSRDILKEE